ncbi:MAG: glycerophosphoryl diester phosphodiesterase membrane domain-containing protein [Propionicimonas sp.]
MLTPTPMLRPSPLDISGLFAGTFAALKQRFGLFVLIALLPFAVSIVLIGGAVAIAISAGVITSVGRSGSALPVGVLVGVVLFIVGIVATLLAQVKSQAMMTVAAYEIAQGGRPDVRGLLARTRGFLPRMAPVIALGIGAILAVYAAFFALAFGVMGAGTVGGRNSGAAIAGLIALVVLIFLLLVPLSIFIQTKLLYTIPAIAIEGLGGIDGLRRSWGLTRGAFWRTLGYYLVASISVAVLSYVVSVVSQLAMTPMVAGVDRTSNASEMFAAFAAMIPLILLTMVLQMAVQLLTLPFVQSYIAYMFIDQVRRSEMPAAPSGYGSTPPAYGYPTAQGPYYPQPGQGYAQPGQQYPQPGQGYPPPGQGYPPPGQGYPQPGQQYPPQGGWQTPPAPGPQQSGPQPPADQGWQPPQQG